MGGLSGTGVSFRTPGKRYIRVDGGKINLATGSSPAFKKSASFIPHTDSKGHYSFESISKPGYYITENKYRVGVEKKVDSDDWKSRASWQLAKGQFKQQTITQGMTQTMTQGPMTETIYQTVAKDEPKQESGSKEEVEREQEQDDEETNESDDDDEDSEPESESEAVEEVLSEDK